MLLALAVGVPLGLFAGMKPDHPLSRLVMTTSIFGFSLPTFWIGLMLIMAFSVTLGWLPSGGRGQTAELFGVQWSWLTADGWRHDPAGHQPVAVQDFAGDPPDPRQRARGAADGLRQVRPCQGLSRRAWC
jgi:ABC-type proline/glycine betaine transport system permease subunit